MTTPGVSLNDAQPKVVRTRSRFPQMSYDLYNTHRFGVYHPFFVMEGVEETTSRFALLTKFVPTLLKRL